MSLTDQMARENEWIFEYVKADGIYFFILDI